MESHDCGNIVRQAAVDLGRQLHCVLNVFFGPSHLAKREVADGEQVIRPVLVVFIPMDHAHLRLSFDAQGITEHANARLVLATLEVQEGERAEGLTGAWELGDCAIMPRFAFVERFFQLTIHGEVALGDVQRRLRTERTMGFYFDVLLEPHDRVEVLTLVHELTAEILDHACVVWILLDTLLQEFKVGRTWLVVVWLVEYVDRKFLVRVVLVAREELMHGILPVEAVARVDCFAQIGDDGLARFIVLEDQAHRVHVVRTIGDHFFDLGNASRLHDLVKVNEHAVIHIHADEVHGGVTRRVESEGFKCHGADFDAQGLECLLGTICRASVQHDDFVSVLDAFEPASDVLGFVLCNCVYGEFHSGNSGLASHGDSG